MKKFKLIVPSFVALIFCMLLIAGSTFALFTSQASASITATSGRVQVSAQFDASSLKVYSAKAVDTIGTYDVEAGIITSGDFAGKYIFDEQHRTSGSYHLFANNPDNTEAGALLENGKLSLIKMTPGDKVTAKLSLVNLSNVNIKYRVKVSLESGLKLFEGLQIKLDGVLLQGVSKTGTWTFLAAPTSTNDNMGDLSIEVLLPLEAGNEYQDLSTVLNFTLEAVQANAKTTNETLNTNIKVNQTVATSGNTVVKDDEELVTVTVPADALNTNITSLTLSVTPTTSTYSTIITSDKASQAYDVKVLEQNSNSSAIKENNEAEIEVNMFVGKDLKGVQLYHNGLAMPTNTWSYNSETGYITFVTTSFSEYTVLYNKDLVVETVTEQGSEFTTYEATSNAGVYEDENGNAVTVNEGGDIVEYDGLLGNGTKSDPFLVYDYETMQKISEYYDLGYYYFAVDMSKTNNGKIDCSGWIPVYLHGSFDGNGVEFTNVTACLFQIVGYQLQNENILLEDFDATMNVSSNGQYGAAALIKNIFNAGVTTFDNVKVHGYLEGFWNMGSFYNYGTANYDDHGCNYEVVFNDCYSDVTLVCGSGNTCGGFAGHSYEGAGNQFIMRINNSSYVGTIFTTTGKAGAYIAMSSNHGASGENGNYIYVNDVRVEFNDGTNMTAYYYNNTSKITTINPTKSSNGYVVEKQANVSKIVVTITAQLTAYDANDVKIPNLSGITMTLSSTELTELDGSNINVLDLFNSIDITKNASEYGAVVSNNILNIKLSSSANYQSGAIRLQVNQYDSTGSIVSAGTVDLATSANANSEWIVK